MKTYIEKPIVPMIVQAEQWFPGSNIPGVIHKPFVPTGGYMDRFTDHGDYYVECGREKITVHPGSWIVVIEGVTTVMSDQQFKNTFIEKK